MGIRQRQRPPSTADWRNRMAARLYEVLKSGQPVPTGAALAQWCSDELDFQPDLADICRELNRRLRRIID